MFYSKRKNTQSPAVTGCRIPGILSPDSKFKRLTTYLVTVFSFSNIIRQENPSYRFVKSGNNIIAIFTKSVYSVPASTKLSLIEVKSKLALQRAKK